MHTWKLESLHGVIVPEIIQLRSSAEGNPGPTAAEIELPSEKGRTRPAPVFQVLMQASSPG